jgi:hypothetical protein
LAKDRLKRTLFSTPVSDEPVCLAPALSQLSGGFALWSAIKSQSAGSTRGLKLIDILEKLMETFETGEGLSASL